MTGLASEPDELGERLAQLLQERGAGGILKDVFDAQDADTGQDALSDTPARQQDGI